MNDKTITLYNYYPKNKIWLKTVIKNVEYRQTSKEIISSNGILTYTKILTCIVPCEAKAEDNKTYIDCSNFEKLSLEEAKNHFTFNFINNKDVVVAESIDKEITKDYTITNLKAEHIKSGTIIALDDNTEGRLLKHWKVVCK